MEFLGDLFGAGASAMSGGLFGLFGSLAGGIFKHFQAKQAQEFKEKAWNHEAELLKLNMQAGDKKFDNELALASQADSYQGLGASLRADSRIGESYRWVNALRSLYRLVLTSALVFISYLIFKELMAGLRVDGEGIMAFGKEEARTLIQYVIYSLVFSTSTAIVWWFGDRAFTPSALKNR